MNFDVSVLWLFLSIFSIPLDKVLSALSNWIMYLCDTVFLFNFCCIPLVVEIIFLFFNNTNEISFVLSHFWRVVRSQKCRVIYVDADVGIHQALHQGHVNIFTTMIRWWDVSERWYIANSDKGKYCFWEE